MQSDLYYMTTSKKLRGKKTPSFFPFSIINQ